MSLSDEERRIMVQLEMERAKKTFDEVDVLKVENYGTVFLIVCIMLFIMRFQLC